MKRAKHHSLKTLLMCASTFSVAPLQAETLQNNPLIRPFLEKPTAAQGSLPGLPPTPKTATESAPSSRTAGESASSAKTAQEDFSLKSQQLNAERVPLPLRLLLAPVYVSAISGNTAILRQPLPLVQQATLAFQGNFAGGTSPQGAPLGGASQGNQFQAQTPLMNNPGIGGVSPLSNPQGLQNNAQTQVPNRPTTIRVTHNAFVNLLGFQLKAKVENNQVLLTLQDNQLNPVVVFQSGIESVSSPQFVPQQNTLEKSDNNYFERVQARSSISGGAASSGKADSGGGAKP